MKLYLDAGHTISDPGAIGLFGTRESAITYLLRDSLKDRLKARGYTVLGNTNEMNLAARIKEANDNKCNYYISLHCNSDTSNSGEGTEIWVKSAGGEAERLAKAVLNDLCSATGLKNRGVKYSNSLAVLRDTNMPAILIETAFIGTKKEEFVLTSPLYQEVFVNALTNSIIKNIPLKKAYEEYFIKDISPEHFGVYIADKTAWDIDIANFITGGFFGIEKTGKTYPAVHLIDSGKVLAKMNFTQPTLYTTNDKKVDIVMTNNPASIPNIRAGISGVAVKMPNASDYDYLKQGWDDSWNYNTVHSMLGIKDKKIYACLIKGSYENLKAYAEDRGFEKAIKLDGGGSAVCRHEGKWIYKAPTNRRINSIVMWER